MSGLAPKALCGRGTRTRWIVAAVIAAVLLIGIAGVAIAHFRGGGGPAGGSTAKASTCSDTYKLAALRPSQIAAATPLCLVESLKFSGEVAGAVGQAYPVNTGDAGPSPVCSVPKRWDGFPEVRLAMTIGGKAYRFRISAPGRAEHQAVTLNNLASIVELASISGPSGDWNQATGTLTLNPDGITGTIDARLMRDVVGAPTVRVSGAWACGAPLALQAPDPTSPCASFYALNQLPDTDVARMKAHGCNAQNLTFSGDITATLDHALTDLSFPSNNVVYQDNLCDQAHGVYVATMKFSIGDETFQLHLQAEGYPSVGPGQFSAKGPVFLRLGNADPTQHGLFLMDQRVEWDGVGGVFTIAPDMKSGTIDADLSGPVLQDFSSVHIAGSWRCAA
jgi:hypothetical protein